jgi:hypothetical protein
MTDLLLRRVSESRPGAEGQDDYDVVGPDGMIIGRIFKASRFPNETPWQVASLRSPRRPLAHARLRADARGGDGGIREELEAWMRSPGCPE